jgi:hypothetical protein
VFSIVDEVATILENMPRIFESNANNEPPIDT